MHANDALVRPRGDELRHTLGLSQGERTPRPGEWEARGLHRVAELLLGLRLGEADRRQLGVRVDDIRHEVVVHARILSEDRVHRDLALRRRDVRELRRARVTDAIADRPDTAHAGAHVLVDGDAEPVGGEAGLLDPRVVRDSPGAKQHLVGLEALRLAVDLRGNGHGRAVAADLSDLRVREHLEATRLEHAQEERERRFL